MYCLEKNDTINGDYYIAILDRLSVKIQKKIALHAKEVLLHQDNAPCKKSMKAQQFPDWAPISYWLFAEETWVKRKRDCRN